MPIYGVPKVRGLCSVNQRSQFRFAELKQRCFERRTSTGGGGWSFGCFCPNFRQIQSITVKRLTDTNFVVSRHIKRKKGSLPADVGHSKKRLCSAQPTSFHVPYSAHSYLICQWEKAYLKLSQFSVRGKSSALTQSISFHQAITNPANVSRVSTQYVVRMPAYESKPLTDRGARLTLLDVFLFPFDLWFSVIITLVACFRLF